MQPLSLEKAAPEESHYISHNVSAYASKAGLLSVLSGGAHTHSVRYPLASQRCRADRWAALRGN